LRWTMHRVDGTDRAFSFRTVASSFKFQTSSPYLTYPLHVNYLELHFDSHLSNLRSQSRAGYFSVFDQYLNLVVVIQGRAEVHTVIGEPPTEAQDSGFPDQPEKSECIDVGNAGVSTALQQTRPRN